MFALLVTGAILDLQGEEICIAYCNSRLDIEDCVIINGNVRFRGYDDAATHLLPEGSVRYVTFYKPHDYGVRMYACGSGILLERNIVVDPVDTGPGFSIPDRCTDGMAADRDMLFSQPAKLQPRPLR